MNSRNNSHGFTLIELLVVIAALAILIALVIVMINPLEQIQKGRDVKRKANIASLQRALQAYYTTRGALFPVASASWMDNLKASYNLQTIPSAVSYQSGTDPCTGNPRNGYCYNAYPDTTEAIVYTKLETKTEKAKCSDNEIPYYLWSSVTGANGTACISKYETEPFPVQSYVILN